MLRLDYAVSCYCFGCITSKHVAPQLAAPEFGGHYGENPFKCKRAVKDARFARVDHGLTVRIIRPTRKLNGVLVVIRNADHDSATIGHRAGAPKKTIKTGLETIREQDSKDRVIHDLTST